MGQDVNSLLTGLTSSLDKYLGLQQQNQAATQQAEYKSALDTQKDMSVAAYKRDLDTEHELSVKQYSDGLENLLTPEMAEKAMPGFGGSMVADYNKQNPNNPLKLKEGTDYLKAAISKLDANNTADANRQQREGRIILEFGQRMRNDFLLKKMAEKELALDTSDALAALVKAGNTVAASGMGAQTARAMGEVGVLTQEDVKNYITSRQLTRGTADKLLLWMKGKPTDATLDEIREINAVIKDRFDARVRPITDDYVVRLSESMGVSKEAAANKLNVPYEGRVKGEKKEKAAPADAKPIIHTYPSGKKAIFNQQTNQWEPFNG